MWGTANTLWRLASFGKNSHNAPTPSIVAITTMISARRRSGRGNSVLMDAVGSPGITTVPSHGSISKL